MTVAQVKVTTQSDQITVTNPFDGSIVGTAALSVASEIEDIVGLAKLGFSIARAMPRHRRASILEKSAHLVEIRLEDFARLIVREAGKTIRQARKEATRCVNTLRLSAAEARRNAGEVVPFDSYTGSELRKGWFSREPLGIIAAITPYNDPLNLVAHKLGPAIAGGNSVVLKPSDLTPLSAIKLGVQSRHLMEQNRLRNGEIRYGTNSTWERRNN